MRKTMGKRYGLIGNPLGHSFSPQIHESLGGYRYDLFQMEEEQVATFLKSLELDGINVTIPYKQTVMPYLDRISPEAIEIGSVNTVVKESDGSLSGYNTDAFGFTKMLEKGGIGVSGKKVLVLGSGGSSKTAVYALKQLGAKSVTVISRSGENNYQNIEKHADAEVIVNTTPLGMYPKNGEQAVDLASFSHLTGVADIIYNPEKTALILQAEELGVPSISGLYMLVAQAARASELFLGVRYSDVDIERVYAEINEKMRNITLVGMPGCGKSSVGRALAEILGRELADSDEYITKKHGRTPEQIILQEGEQVFRRLETEALSELTRRCGLVLSTGGGAVTVPENHRLLRQNGAVVFINRDISLLETKGRPLSFGDGKLKKMYEVRLPLYRAVCDFEIKTDEKSDILQTAKKIVEILRGGNF